jgi:hypothetical protein
MITSFHESQRQCPCEQKEAREWSERERERESKKKKIERFCGHTRRENKCPPASQPADRGGGGGGGMRCNALDNNNSGRREQQPPGKTGPGKKNQVSNS